MLGEVTAQLPGSGKYIAACKLQSIVSAIPTTLVGGQRGDNPVGRAFAGVEKLLLPGNIVGMVEG